MPETKHPKPAPIPVVVRTLVEIRERYSRLTAAVAVFPVVPATLEAS